MFSCGNSLNGNNFNPVSAQIQRILTQIVNLNLICAEEIDGDSKITSQQYTDPALQLSWNNPLFRNLQKQNYESEERSRR